MKNCRVRFIFLGARGESHGDGGEPVRSPRRCRERRSFARHRGHREEEGRVSQPSASRHSAQTKLLTKPLPTAHAVRESMNYGAPAPGRGRGGSSGDRTSPRREFGDGDTNVVQGGYGGGGLGDGGVVRREDAEAKASEKSHGLR
ncbi:hypothetical protein ACQ4PT_032695 [Festuca glaucescens]